MAVISELKQRTKNLFNIDNPLIIAKSKWDISGNYIPKIENGIIYSGGLLGSSSGSLIVIETNNHLEFTFSGKCNLDTYYVQYYAFNGYDQDTNIIDDSLISLGLFKINKTIKLSTNYKYIGIGIFAEEKYGAEITNLQIEYGSVATDYQPYYLDITKYNNSIISNITFNDIDYHFAKKATAKGKNLFDITKITHPNITIQDNKLYMPINTTGNGYCSTGTKLKDLCPALKVGDVAIITFETNGSRNFVFIKGPVWFIGKERIITQQDLDSYLVFYGNDTEVGETHQVVISNISIELAAKNKICNNAVEEPIIDLQINGTSFQDGVPTPDVPIEVQSVGEKTKNLFNEKVLLESSNAEKTEDGYLLKYYPVVYSQTSALVTHLKKVLKPNTTYTLSRKINNYTKGNDGSIWFRNEADEILVNVSYGLGIKFATFSLTQEQIDSIYNVYIYGRQETSILYEYIQLEEGDMATIYEPYGYKIPTLINRQNTVNFIDYKSLYTGRGKLQEYITNNKDDSFTCVYGIYGAGVFSDAFYLSAGDYTFSAKIKLDYEAEKASVGLTQITNINTIPQVFDTKIFDQYFSVNNEYSLCSIDFKITESGYYAYRIQPTGNASNYKNCPTTFKDVMIAEKGIIDYKPYRDKIIDIYLNEPLRKIGDYADYIDYKNKKVVRNIKTKIFDGTEEFKTYNSNANNLVVYTIINDTLKAYSSSLCNKMQNINQAWATPGANKFGIYSDHPTVSNKYFRAPYSTITTADEFKQYLADEYAKGEPLILIYTLVAPIEEDLNIPEIILDKGKNIFSINLSFAPSKMDIEYWKQIGANDNEDIAENIVKTDSNILIINTGADITQDGSNLLIGG